MSPGDPWDGVEQPALGEEVLPEDAWGPRLPADRIEVGGDVRTAQQLVDRSGCSPQCLVSPPSHRRWCDCTCRGHYHGALSDADMVTAVRRLRAEVGAL